MMMGESGGTSRSTVASAPAVVVVQIAPIAAAAPAPVGVAAVIVIRVAPCRSWIDGLHGDLGSGLGCGVEGLSAGVILCPELHCGLHGDFRLLGKAMAAVGRRRATVAWGRSTI